jgi:hypothetical protein
VRINLQDDRQELLTQQDSQDRLGAAASIRRKFAPESFSKRENGRS